MAAYGPLKQKSIPMADLYTGAGTMAIIRSEAAFKNKMLFILSANNSLSLEKKDRISSATKNT
jgi:hypothetical protein